MKKIVTGNVVYWALDSGRFFTYREPDPAYYFIANNNDQYIAKYLWETKCKAEDLNKYLLDKLYTFNIWSCGHNEHLIRTDEDFKVNGRMIFLNDIKKGDYIQLDSDKLSPDKFIITCSNFCSIFAWADFSTQTFRYNTKHKRLLSNDYDNQKA